LLIIFVYLAGCVHLSSVSVTSIPPNGQTIEAVAESRYIVMGINPDNDFADDVVKDLREKCPGGKVQGILTKHEVIVYPFVQQHRVTARGQCVL